MDYKGCCSLQISHPKHSTVTELIRGGGGGGGDDNGWVLWVVSESLGRSYTFDKCAHTCFVFECDT